MNTAKETPRSTLAGTQTGHSQTETVVKNQLPSGLPPVNELEAIQKTTTVIENLIYDGEGLAKTVEAAERYVLTNGYNHITKADLFNLVGDLYERNHGGKNTPLRANTSQVPQPVPFDGEAAPPIPPEIVPGAIGRFSTAISEGYQVPYELAFINALGATATAAQRKFKVRVRNDYFEPLCLYAMGGLPPGERKSATAEACKKPLVKYQKARQIEMEQVRKDALSDKLTIEESIKQARSRAAKAKTDDKRRQEMENIKKLERQVPNVPPMPRLLADDFTPEQLAVMMAEHKQRIGVIEAEGGLFEILAGRYTGGIPNIDAVLKFWSGEAVQVDRRGRDAVCLDDPHLTLCISPQPEVVQGLASKPGFRGRGLIGRFLYVMPESRLGYRDTEAPPISETTRHEYESMILSLLDIPWAVDENGEPTSHIIELSPEAYSKWRELSQMVEHELRSGGEFEFMRDWAGKFPGQAARIAGLFHVSTTPDPHKHPVSVETMGSALRVALILAEHAKKAFALMGSDEATECAKSILDWIRRDHVAMFSARDALNKVRGRFPNMAAVKPGLKVLDDRNYIFGVETATGRVGRPKGDTYMVNPTMNSAAADAWAKKGPTGSRCMVN